MGMFGKGAPKQPSFAQMQQQAMPKMAELPTGFSGIGYRLPQQPEMPGWATGDWAMPWFGQPQEGYQWGEQPPDVKAQASEPDPEPAAQGLSAETIRRMIEANNRQQQMRQYMVGDPDYGNMMQQQGYGYDGSSRLGRLMQSGGLGSLLAQAATGNYAPAQRRTQSIF
jgi:hypothetical protein